MTEKQSKFMKFQVDEGAYTSYIKFLKNYSETADPDKSWHTVMSFMINALQGKDRSIDHSQLAPN